MENKENDLEYTGERLIPDLPEFTHLYQEHIIRYMFATQFVESKTVLDAGCGTGYGPFLLSQKSAKKVVGIDLSKEAIAYCNSHYKSPNLEFKEDDCTRCHFNDSEFDIITSFEVIEHLKDPRSFLSEVKRVLKKDGLFILSTPNKITYPSDNPFHFLEYTESEFRDLLEIFFLNVSILYQEYPPTLAIHEPGQNKKIQEFNMDKPYINRDSDSALYFVAICSNKKIPKYSSKVFLFNEKTLMLENYPRLPKLQEEFEERSKWANELDHKVNELQTSLSSKDSKIENLQTSLSSKDSQIENLQNLVYDLKGKFTAQEHSILFGTVIRISKGLDRFFPAQTKRGEILRLIRLSILIAKNEGGGILLQAFREKIKKEAIPQKTQYMLGVRKLPKPELPKIDTTKPTTKPYIIRNFGISKIDKQLRKDIEVGSSNILSLPSFPKVSIIIATYNQVGFLKKALKSIESKTTYKNYEIITVTNNLDENSEMRKFLNTLKYPTYVYTKEYSWGGMNNFAVKKATGDFILILNDDIEIVTPSWLEAMLHLALDHRVAAVGPKLLFPDKRLQEAGCIIWQNGTGWNYGRNGNPDEGDYNFVRVVDYCTACCLLIKKSLFEKMNGFDLRYEIGYYEDTDLCFSFAKAGYKVLYQPLAEVIHYEGRTQGTDLSTGNKSFQLKNAKKFYESWKDVLKSRNSDSLENTLIERNRKKGANILFIDHYLPEFDKDSGSLDSFYNLGILSSLDHKVTFWPDNLAKTEPYTTELQQKGIEVIFGINNFNSFIKERGWLFHLCFLTRPHISIKYLDLIKKYVPKCKIVYDTVDLHYVQQMRQANTEKNSLLLEKARKIRQMEFDIISKSDITIVKSEEEANILLNEFPSLKIAIIPPCRIPEEKVIPFEERQDLLFVGGFNHPPNVDSIKNLVSTIFPKIKEKIPGVKLFVIGSNPTKEIVDLCSNSEDIVFLGYVKNLKTHLQKARILVAPLRYGAGVKGKITQSLANQLPVVTTSIGSEGITKKDGDFLYIADNENDFAQKTAELYKNKNLWNQFSIKGFKYAKTHYSPELARDILNKIIVECFKDN